MRSLSLRLERLCRTLPGLHGFNFASGALPVGRIGCAPHQSDKFVSGTDIVS